MRRQNFKIITALIVAFFLSHFLSNFIFFASTPVLRKINLATLFPTRNPTLIPTPTTIPILIQPTNIKINQITPTLTPQPNLNPTVSYPTNRLLPTSTPRLIPTTFQPTNSPTSICPTTSNQQYHDQGVGMSDPEKLRPPLDNNPDINLYLRGFTAVNEGAHLISRNGNTYGLDDQMPPQISSLYGGPVPNISATYRIYEWDYQNNISLAPQTATPAFPVHMLGLQSTPGQPLVGLRAERQIDSEGDVFITLYATDKFILFQHSADDNLSAGYLFYFVDICVDPNLLKQYENDNNTGRTRLPAIHPGQVFGYAKNNEVKFVIRDSGSFMDTRYKEDWWEYK